jgi:hypothetical protein
MNLNVRANNHFSLYPSGQPFDPARANDKNIFKKTIGTTQTKLGKTRDDRRDSNFVIIKALFPPLGGILNDCAYLVISTRLTEFNFGINTFIQLGRFLGFRLDYPIPRVTSTVIPNTFFFSFSPNKRGRLLLLFR